MLRWSALILLLLTASLAADSPDAQCEPNALIAKPDFQVSVTSAYRAAEGGYEVTVKNNEKFPVYLDMRMTKLVNLTSAKGKSFVVPVAAESEIVAVHLRVRNPALAANFNYTFDTYLNDVKNTKHNPKTEYELPFQAGFSSPILQGYRGKFSHNTEINLHALDFGMPRGTPILAARDGMVIASRSDMRSGGIDPSLLNSVDSGGNLVMVLHDDGTVGHYYHMRCGSITLKKGDAVKAGDTIGLAGATGYSHPDYPHLHFVVRVPDQKNRFGRKTVPTLFRTGTGVKLLKEGESYKK